MSTSEVQTIIQDVFSVAEQDLDADEIIGKLFSAYIIDYRKYQSIQKKETTIDKNRALLEHLYETADKEMLTQFCTILKDSTRPKHMKLECLICKKLESVQSSSTSESKSDKEDEEEEDDLSSDPDFCGSRSPIQSDITPWRRPQANSKGIKLFPRKRARIEDSDSEPDDYNETEKWHSECAKLLCRMCKEEFAEPFIDPVDEADAPGYSSYIKNPMCLKKIKENLEGGVYQTEVDVFEDLQRIVDNSKEYNTRPDSKIYQWTLELEAFIETERDALYGAIASEEKCLRRKVKLPQH